MQISLLLICVSLLVVSWLSSRKLQQTKRDAAAKDAVARLSANTEVVELLGKPIAIQPGLQGEVKEDETGWQEVRLTIPLQGSHGDAVARVAGGKLDGPWNFSTFEVIVEKQHKKVDLISGRVTEYDSNAYTDVHTLPVAPPEFVDMPAAAPTLDGRYPCVVGVVGATGAASQLGKCAMSAIQGRGPVDQFEADLRYGAFIMRETDLYLVDVFQVPLTRTYASNDWATPNHVHVFGWNSNHPYDIAPVGTRNPYTWQMIVLEDGDFLYFDRISKGTGYANAVYRHTETSTRFYKAIHQWNGNGWTTRLADGSEVFFPESYNAKIWHKEPPIEMRNAQGDRLVLLRDPQRNLKEIRTPHGHWIRFR